MIVWNKMEKLIELLNEYEEDKIKNSKWLDVLYIWGYEWTLHYYNNYKDENVFDNVRFLIISKEYWFIKRLVDNNKIDFYNILKENWTFRKEFYAIENKKEYERLIMLLSIEDEPIEFLIDNIKVEDRKKEFEELVDRNIDVAKRLADK